MGIVQMKGFTLVVDWWGQKRRRRMNFHQIMTMLLSKVKIIKFTSEVWSIYRAVLFRVQQFSTNYFSYQIVPMETTNFDYWPTWLRCEFLDHLWCYAADRHRHHFRDRNVSHASYRIHLMTNLIIWCSKSASDILIIQNHHFKSEIFPQLKLTRKNHIIKY